MIRAIAIIAVLLAVPAHAKDNNPFSGATSISVAMTRDRPAENCTASEYGIGDGYHGKRAADGSIFNTHASAPYTVAHRTRRLGSYVTVTNLATGLSIRAKVTDRGPYYHARCVDLGRAGARAIGMSGLAKVTVR
jgi:rare lipoprotein A